MAKEDIRQSFYRNDNLTLWFEEQKIVDSPERVFACYNACRGLNPEHVPELVAKLISLCELADSACDENVGAGCSEFFPEQSPELRATLDAAKELLAKVKQ